MPPIRPPQPDVFGPVVAVPRGRQRVARPGWVPAGAPAALFAPIPAFVELVQRRLLGEPNLRPAVAAELWGHAVADVFRENAHQAGRGVAPAADHIVANAVLRRAEQLLDQRVEARDDPMAQMRAWREVAPPPVGADLFALHPERRRPPMAVARQPRFAQRHDLNDYDSLPGNARLPEPYATVLKLDFVSAAVAPSVHRQLRFFAALSGRVQPFALTTQRSSRQFNLDQRRDDNMLGFVRRKLVNPGTMFEMRFADGIGVQIHGENYVHGTGSIGEALGHYTEQFTAALQLSLERAQNESQHQTLRRLAHSIQNWCFDGSMTRLNQFLQEEHLTGADLSLVPNFDDKHTIEDQGYECLRVFRLHAARMYEAATGNSAQDERGSLRPDFIKQWFNEQTFARFLKDKDIFPQHSRVEIRRLIRHLVDEIELLPRKWATPTRARTTTRH